MSFTRSTMETKVPNRAGEFALTEANFLPRLLFHKKAPERLEHLSRQINVLSLTFSFDNLVIRI